MFDIVTPSGNEKELLEKAIALGITNIMFLYQTKNSNELNEKRKKFGANVGILFKPKNISDAKKINEKLYLEADLIAATSQDDRIIRALCENPMIDVVFGTAASFGKDALDYRRSGMNAILANIMKDNKQSFAVSFSNILNESGSKRAKLLGREMQNIQLTRRKVPLIIASFAAKPEELRLPENLAAVLRVLGANYPQSKAATSTVIENIIKRKELRRSKEFVRPGVRIVQA
ncbi:MAG: hypothetical protein HY438_01370 [DPANN group archaeon]|nr:hypothetical protein [DPANN group archaeon]